MKKNIMALVFLALGILVTSHGFGQELTFKGKVINSENQKPLSNISIYLEGKQTKSTPTNESGEFYFKMDKGTYKITIDGLGFISLSDTLELTENTSKNYFLGPQYNELSEIDVYGNIQKDRTQTLQTGKENLSKTEIDKIPVFLGEKDILKTIQLKPGVISAGEGVSGFNVRGGSADQNLVQLDQMQIFNAAHLLGFFSIFNADAIGEIELYKGTQPGEFGGRLSSVLVVNSASIDTTQWSFKGGIGLIASRFTANGPLVKGKSGITLSARRTYADMFTKLSSNNDVKNAILNFYDLNGAIQYKISEKDFLKLSFYNGRDNFGSKNNFGISWGNSNLGINWTHQFNHLLSGATTLTANNYNYEIKIGNNYQKITVNSQIQNLNIKHHFLYHLNPHYQMKFGLDATLFQINPRKIINTFSNTPQPPSPLQRGLENALFISNEWTELGNFDLNYGVRVSGFTVLNPPPASLRVSSENNGIPLTQKLYGGNSYINIEPRLGINYHLNKNEVFKLFYGKNTQNLHIINNIAASMPTEIYLLSSPRTRPQVAHQVSLGYFHTLNKGKYEASLEGFYKKFNNLIDYEPISDVNSSGFGEKKLQYGRGNAYGIELYGEKKTGNLRGWLSYTFSRSFKQINLINDNSFYPAKQDKPHVISMVAIYDINKRWNVSAAWTYLTGTPTTFPRGNYKIDDYTLNYYEKINQDRFPDYHRLDVSVNFKGKNFDKKRFYSEWNLSIYNAYNRYNTYFITYTKNVNENPVFEQTSLFGIIPSITYNFKF